jgi:hypothetical protein
MAGFACFLNGKSKCSSDPMDHSLGRSRHDGLKFSKVPNVFKESLAASSPLDVICWL